MRGYDDDYDDDEEEDDNGDTDSHNCHGICSGWWW